MGIQYCFPYWGVTILMEFSLSQDGNLIMLYTSKVDLCTTSSNVSKSTWQNAVEKCTKAWNIHTAALYHGYHPIVYYLLRVGMRLKNFIIPLSRPYRRSLNEKTWLLSHFRWVSVRYIFINSRALGVQQLFEVFNTHTGIIELLVVENARNCRHNRSKCVYYYYFYTLRASID